MSRKLTQNGVKCRVHREGGEIMAKRLIVLDENTSEYEDLGYGKFIPESQDMAIRKQKMKKDRENEQGDFIWFLFNYCDTVFPDLSCPSITRLFYISTFVEYNGDRLTDDGGYTFLNKRQIKRKLNLPDKVFTNFWNEMKSRNILSENDDKDVVLNRRLFRKGSIDKRCGRDFTRIYCSCVRYIYENTKNIRDHAKLAYIFKIIPYVNRKTNIVCYNPEELDDKKIKPMSIGDFCDIIKYNRNQASRLFKDLLKFTVKGKHLMCYVAIDSYVITKMFMIINPEIYYGGEKHSDVKFLFEICDRQASK